MLQFEHEECIVIYTEKWISIAALNYIMPLHLMLKYKLYILYIVQMDKNLKSKKIKCMRNS